MQLADLQIALQNAQAAGDTGAVNSLTAYIKQLQGSSAQLTGSAASPTSDLKIALQNAQAAGDTAAVNALSAHIDRLEAAYAPVQPKPQTGFIPSVIRGGRGIVSLAADVLPAMAAKAVGADEYARRQMEEAAAYQEETQKLYPAAVPSYKDVKDVGTALTYVQEAIGEALPSILPSLFTGGAFSIAAKGAQLAAGQAARKAVLDAAAKGVITKEVEEQAFKAGLEAAKRVALKYEATGALAGSAALNVPEVYQNLYEKAEGQLPDLAPALVAGGFNAVLDAITPLSILRKARLSGIPEEQIIGAWYKRAGKGAAKGFFTEGGTEAVQEMSSAAAENFVNQNAQFFTPENFSRFLDAGLKGGFGGAAITSTADVAFGRKETPKAPEPTAETAPEAEEPAAPPAVDVNAPEFKKKLAKYQALDKGVKDLEALGDTLTTRQKATLTTRRKKAAALKQEIDDALAQVPPKGEERVSETEPGAVGAGFEILEQPITPEAPRGVAAPAPAGVVSTGEPAGESAAGEGAAPAAVAAPEIQVEAPPTPPVVQAPAAAAAPEAAPVPAAPEAVAPTPPAPPTPPQIPAPTPPVVEVKPTVTPPKEAVPAKPSVAQNDLDELSDILGGDETLKTAGTARRTQAQIEQDKRADAMGKRYGVTRQDGEATKDYALRIKKAIEFAKRAETERLSDIPAADVAAQELKQQKPYFAPQEQRVLYEETAEEFNAGIDEEKQRAYDEEYKDALDEGLSEAQAKKRAEDVTAGYNDDKLPKYEELSDDERRVYFQENIAVNNQKEHDKAATKLSEYLASKRQESRTKVETDERETAARESYNRERKAHGEKTSLAYTFPAWNALSDESKQVYKDINKTNTALEQDMAFRAVKAQIRKEKVEAQAKEALTEAELRAKQEMLQAAEQALKKQPAGKGAKLPETILKDLFSDNIGAVLDYLKINGSGLKGKKAEDFFRIRDPKTGKVTLRKKGVTIRDSVAREVFRNLSDVLSGIPDFKVNVVLDENMALDSLGEYDAKTNTVFLSPRGLDEATLLHELTHAATVKIIHQYFTDKTKLSPKAREAVEHIINIAAAAKVRLSGQYPNAFENLYEFVAYAMTDADFQNALAQIQISSLAKATAKAEPQAEEVQAAREFSGPQGYPYAEDNLWSYFTGALAYLYRLFTPSQRKQALLFPTETSRVTQKSQEQIEREAARKKKREEAEAEVAAEEAPAEGKPTLEDEAEFEGLETIEATQLFDSPEQVDEAQIPAIEGEMTTRRGVTNLRRAILREPGYKGNLLLEVSAAFQDILAAPEGGIEQLAAKGDLGTRLQAKAAPTTKAAAPGKPPSEYTDEEFAAQINRELSPKERGGRAFLKSLLTERGYDWFVQKFQNERQAIKKVFERAEKFGIVKRIGEGINDVWGQLTRSTGMAVDLYATVMKPLVDEVHSGVEAYADKLGISVNEALGNLHAILESRHEGERRHIKYLLNVPLDDKTKYTVSGFVDKKGQKLAFSAAGWREHILEQLTRTDVTKNDIKRMRRLLEQIVASPKMHDQLIAAKDKSRFDENSANYNVIGDRPAVEIARMKKVFDKPEYKAEIDRIAKALKKVHEETKRLNQTANYWSTPVQNVVDFYAYENYVPFKGRAGKTVADPELDFGSKRIGGELQEMTDTFEGRMSESENPLLQSLAEGAAAAMRAGRQELTLAIKNAIKDGIIDGKVSNKIKFEDRYLKGETRADVGGPDKIFHYTADGTIEVLQIKNKQQLDAIRRSYRVSQPIIDIANSLTSAIGQTHTRYNPAFAPMNFVRDSLTNAFMLGAELGPKRAGRLIKGISAEVASGGLYRAMRFSQLYSNGKFAEINRLAGGTAPYESLNSEQKYYRDLSEYVKLGGKVSYLQGVAAKGALDGLMKEIGRSQILKTKDQIDKFFDIYNEMFELAARVGAYRMLKEEFVAEGAVLDEAKARATEMTKNLANFEQVGQWGKAAGAAFMFFRPAATGAVRAIDSLRPAFGFDEEAFRAEAMGEGRTKEQIDKAIARMRKERDHARAMAGGLAGMGAGIYFIAMMMAGDDEQERNRILTDDMARWTRYARFFIPGFENPVQIPWGFGLGSFAAAGAQIAGAAAGKTSFTDMASNILTVGLDSFLPLPFSRISPLDNFPAFMIDSLTPSAFRPFFEYVMNLDGLGREIYNNRQTRYGDAYTGGDNIPELYKDAARMLFKATDGAVDWSPNTLYFFANNYLDGAMRAVASGYNAGLTITGQKDFSAKNDLLFAASFVGTKSNIDAREFSKAETYIKGIDKRLGSLQNNPEAYARFVQENPDKVILVQMYNEQVNGSLRNLRQVANQLRVSGLSPAERKAQLDQIVNVQNIVKRQILTGFEAVSGYKP